MTVPEMAIEDLCPGDIIEFGDATELASFEDLVAASIDTQVDNLLPGRNHKAIQDGWAGRVAIKELIRPKTFNGTIADIRLEVMEDPYARLLDAKQRGKTMLKGFSIRRTNEFAELLAPLYAGFSLTALAKSTGRPSMQLQTEIWYAPVNITSRRKGSAYQDRGSSGGASVQRFMTKPEIEEGTIEAINEESRRIGFKVLRNNMRHPIIQSMQQ